MTSLRHITEETSLIIHLVDNGNITGIPINLNVGDVPASVMGVNQTSDVNRTWDMKGFCRDIFSDMASVTSEIVKSITGSIGGDNGGLEQIESDIDQVITTILIIVKRNQSNYSINIYLIVLICNYIIVFIIKRNHGKLYAYHL